MNSDVSILASNLHLGPPSQGIGARRVALLEAIGQLGSIAAAARAVNLSYKGAWDAVNAMNNLAGQPLVERTAGGAGGGGTVLTARAHRLVATYRAAEVEQRRFLEQLNRRIEALSGDDLHLMERLAMQTSARNQLFGTVAEITQSEVNAEVIVDLAGGDRLAAIITHASADNLGLAPGVTVTALIKASWLILAAGDQSLAGLSTRNRLVGTVASIANDRVASEVTLRLPGGATLVATITRESADTLALAEGDTATALFKASSVILAQSD